MQALLSIPTTVAGPTGLQLVGMRTMEHPAPDRLYGPTTDADLPGSHQDGGDHMQSPLPPPTGPRLRTGPRLLLGRRARGRYDWYRSKYRTPTHGANRKRYSQPCCGDDVCETCHDISLCRGHGSSFDPGCMDLYTVIEDDKWSAHTLPYEIRPCYCGLNAPTLESWRHQGRCVDIDDE